jgi:Uma2 family endonuclease
MKDKKDSRSNINLNEKGTYSAKDLYMSLKERASSYGNEARRVDNPYGDKMQGEYTIEDYAKLPEDKRFELIDGVLFEMEAPTTDHQKIAGYLHYELMKCVEEHGMPCYPYIAPVDVQLDKDIWTMVQPDVLICCDHELDTGKRIFGAPDFAAEILSPSSRGRDMFLKFNKYKKAGVREYWMIDPKKQQVLVYLFYKENDVSAYNFEDHIPVSISDGLCEVCFSKLIPRLVGDAEAE